jgi:hypothetical protein
MSVLVVVVAGGALLLGWSVWRMVGKPGPRS